MATNAGQNNIANSGFDFRGAIRALSMLFIFWGVLWALTEVFVQRLGGVVGIENLVWFSKSSWWIALSWILALPAAMLTSRVGYSRALVLGLGLLGLGAALFYPAIEWNVLYFMVGSYITMVLGTVVLYTTAMPYMAVLGSFDSSASRLNRAMAWFSLASLLTPLLAGSVLAMGSWGTVSIEKPGQLMFLVVAVLWVALAVFFALWRMPKVGATTREDDSEPETIPAAWAYTHLILSAIAVLLYTGIELGMLRLLPRLWGPEGLALLGNQLPVGGFVALFTAGLVWGRFLAATWLGSKKLMTKIFSSFAVAVGAYLLTVVFTQNSLSLWAHLKAFDTQALLLWFTGGTVYASAYLVLIALQTTVLILARKKAALTIAIASGLGLILFGLAMVNNFTFTISGVQIHSTVWALLAVGLVLAPIFPSVFSLGLHDLGKSTAQGSGIMVLAMSGGVLLPMAMNLLIVSAGLKMALVVPMLALVYLLYYGIDGYRVRQLSISSGITDAAIGIDIGADNTEIAVIDRRGTILSSAKLPMKDLIRAEELVDAVNTRIESLLLETAQAVDIKGVGIAAPSANPRTGKLEKASSLPFGDDVPLLALFERKMKLPVRLVNDANAAALGEWKYGVTRNMQNFVSVSLGNNMGSGIVANGALLTGANGHAGELGHANVQPDGRLCSCGKRGCLQTYVSANGLVRTLQTLLADTMEPSALRAVKPDELTGEAIYNAALSGDVIAIKAFAQTGQLLGRKLADTVAHLSPEAIVLTGGLAQAGDLLLAPVRKALTDNLLPVYTDSLSVAQSALSGNAALLGAASLVWEYIDQLQLA